MTKKKDTASVVANAVSALRTMIVNIYAGEKGFDIKVLKKTKNSLIVEYKFKKEGVVNK